MNPRQIDIQEQLIAFGVMEETAETMARAFAEGLLFEVRSDGKAYVTGEKSDCDFEAFRRAISEVV